MKHKKMITILLTIALCITTAGIDVQKTKAAETSTVGLQVDSAQPIEIALGVGNTKVNYANFENDLREELVKQGVDSNRIAFTSVEGSATAAKNEFAWWTYDHTNSTTSYNQASHIYLENNSSPYSGSGGNPCDSQSRHIVTSNNGKTMKFYGYGVSGYKDFNFMPNEQATKKTIQFTIYEQEAHDAFDGVGFLINSSITGSTYGPSGDQKISGYLLFLQYDGASGQSIKLFELKGVNTYTLHQSMSNKIFSQDKPLDDKEKGSIERLATATTAYSASHKYRKLKIEVMPDYVKVWYNGGTSNNSGVILSNSDLVKWEGGSNLTNYPLTPQYDTVNGKDIIRGGYGPLVSYQGHSCKQPTYATLDNLSMEAEYVRELTNVIREPNWDPDKMSFLVNLNEDPIEDFSDKYTTGEIINRLADDNITYLGWCGKNNANQSKVFVDGIGNGSALINLNDTDKYGTSPYSTDSYKKQIKDIANAIVYKLNLAAPVGVHTYLSTEKFQFSAIGATLDDGNWSVGYNKDSFERAKDSISTYQNLANASFNQSGYYEIYYNNDITKPKGKIRIHEAPVALFNAQIEDGRITVQNHSYDPEFCSNIAAATGAQTDGIKKNTIEYRNLADENPVWTGTAPTTISNSDTWMIRLTVEDADGEMSTMMQQLAQRSDVAPYGTFRLSSTQYIKGIDDNVAITDASYTLDGSSDFHITYKIKDSSGNVKWTSNSTEGNTNYFAPNTTYQYALSNLGVGTYTVTMTATKGTATSAEVSKTFKVAQGYKITYDVNMGVGAPETQYKVQGQELQLSTIAPTKSGFTFGGWEDMISGNKYEPGEKYSTNATLQLKAIWYENMLYTATGYTGVYDGKMHEITVNVANPTAGADIAYGTSKGSYTAPALPYKNPGIYTVYFKVAKDGYQPVTSSRDIKISKAPAHLTLEDKSVNYTGLPIAIGTALVTGVSNTDYSDGTISYRYYIDKECTTPTNGTNSGALAEGGAPAKPGVYYAKAHITEGTNYLAADSNAAKLTLVSYSVTFNMNGHGDQITPTTGIAYGTYAMAPKRPVDDDFSFDGWYKDQECIEPWNFTTETILKNTTIYAKWSEKSKHEVSWIIGDETYYGSLTEALEKAADISPADIKIELNKDLSVSTEVQIPGNVELLIPEGKKMEIAQGGKLVVESSAKVTNDGTIQGEGEIDNQGTITNKVDGVISIDKLHNATGATLVSDGKTEVSGELENEGNIKSEAMWTDNDGGTHYESLKEALGNKDLRPVTLNGDVEIKSELTIPEGLELTVPEGKQLSVGEGGELKNNGKITATQAIPNANTLGSEASWIDAQGKVHYGPAETAIKEAKAGEEVIIINDTELKGAVTIPEGVKVKVSEGTELTVAQDAKITNNGIIQNDGKIDNHGKMENNGSVENENGTIGGKGDFNNRGGNINGGMIEADATITGGSVSGDVTNNGTLAGVQPAAGATVGGTGESKEKQEAPKTAELKVSNPKQAGSSARISGITKDMEYSLDNGVTWIRGNGEDLTGFENGDTVRVRYAKTDVYGASESVVIKVSYEPLPTEGEKTEPISDTKEEVKISEINKVVNLGEGKVNVQTQVGEGVPSINLNTSVPSVIRNTLTKTEQSSVKQGADASIAIQVLLDKSTVSKTKIEQFGNAYMPNGVKTGAFYDISIWKKVGNQTATQLSELDTELEIRLTIPQELRSNNANVKRTYYVSRIHNGVVENLPAVDNGDNTLTIKSSKFSTYAIMYTETVKTNKTPGFIMNGKIINVDGGQVDLSKYVANIKNANEVIYHSCSHTIISISDKGIVRGLKKGSSLVSVILRKGKKYTAYSVNIKVKKASKVTSVVTTFKIKGITYEKTSAFTCQIGNNMKYSKKSVKIPNTVKYKGKTYKVTAIAPCAFMNNKKIKSVSIGQNVKSVNGTSFVGCNKLTAFTVNKKNKYFKTAKSKGMYKGMLLSKNGKTLYTAPAMKGKVTVPSKVQTIGMYAICSTGMKELVLPKTVKTIYPCAFAHNTKMKKVTFKGNVPAMPLNCIFDKISKSAKVVVPKKQLNKYRSAFTSAVKRKQFSNTKRIVKK